MFDAFARLFDGTFDVLERAHAVATFVGGGGAQGGFGFFEVAERVAHVRLAVGERGGARCAEGKSGERDSDGFTHFHDITRSGGESCGRVDF